MATPRTINALPTLRDGNLVARSNIKSIEKHQMIYLDDLRLSSYPVRLLQTPAGSSSLALEGDKAVCIIVVRHIASAIPSPEFIFDVPTILLLDDQKPVQSSPSIPQFGNITLGPATDYQHVTQPRMPNCFTIGGLRQSCCVL